MSVHIIRRRGEKIAFLSDYAAEPVAGDVYFKIINKDKTTNDRKLFRNHLQHNVLEIETYREKIKNFETFVCNSNNRKY